MKYIMEDHVVNDDYHIFFVEQNDQRPFNRGAIKNIGFLVVKNMYPDQYKDFTFIFNDIDTIPYSKELVNYDTERGIIKHFYGFKYALGGFFSITGFDFENINGFCNYWSWGFEDNAIYERAVSSGLVIDRSNFFEIGDMRILHINDGTRRIINRQYGHELKDDSGLNGLSTISNLQYIVEENMIIVSNFSVEYNVDFGSYEVYDIRNGRQISIPKKNNKMNTTTVQTNSLTQTPRIFRKPMRQFSTIQNKPTVPFINTKHYIKRR